MFSVYCCQKAEYINSTYHGQTLDHHDILMERRYGLLLERGLLNETYLQKNASLLLYRHFLANELLFMIAFPLLAELLPSLLPLVSPS